MCLRITGARSSAFLLTTRQESMGIRSHTGNGTRSAAGICLTDRFSHVSATCCSAKTDGTQYGAAEGVSAARLPTYQVALWHAVRVARTSTAVANMHGVDPGSGAQTEPPESALMKMGTRAKDWLDLEGVLGFESRARQKMQSNENAEAAASPCTQCENAARRSSSRR